MTSYDPERYRAVAIAKACKMWAQHKIKANRAYTPTAMLRNAAEITGKSYKRGQHQQAHDDIMAMFEYTGTPPNENGWTP